MMNTGFWETSPISDLSDLDTTWSPNSTGSDQENHYSFYGSSPLQQLHSPASSTSTNTSTPAKRNKCPVKRVHQRNAANQRERKRMRTINEAFEGLRERIPLAGTDRKLSKVDTLRLAIRYIHQLAEMVDTVGSPEGYSQAKQPEKAKVIIRCHGMNGMQGTMGMDSFGIDSMGMSGMAMCEEQYQPQHQSFQDNHSQTSCYTPLYGHSLSWEDMNKPKYGPNNTLCAKVWTPEVETSLTTPADIPPYTNTDFATL